MYCPLGVLPLELEVGCRKGLVRDARLCKFCNTNRVEDELHFIFECPTFDSSRAQPLKSLLDAFPALKHFDNTQKLKFLFYNEHAPTKAVESAANLLLDLMHARDAAK